MKVLIALFVVFTFVMCADYELAAKEPQNGDKTTKDGVPAVWEHSGGKMRKHSVKEYDMRICTFRAKMKRLRSAGITYDRGQVQEAKKVMTIINSRRQLYFGMPLMLQDCDRIYGSREVAPQWHYLTTPEVQILRRGY